MLHSVRSSRGMVTAPHHLAAQAGLDILKDGGTALEASVAVAAALAVVYPHMTGIGGDGFWLIRESDGRVHAIHGCGGAAAKAKLSLYAGMEAIPTRGPLAANTVAGTVSAWQAALEGSALPLSRILRDAIHFAEEGVAITRSGAGIVAAKGSELRAQPGAWATTYDRLAEGDLLRQPALAETLRRIAEEGPASFYTGALAADIAADLAGLGSPVSANDLAAHRAERRAPLQVEIDGARLYNSAPPTQGFASLLILALFDRLAAPAAESFDHVHGLVEATKQAFLLRDAFVGDPAYMQFDCQALLDDPVLLDELAARIDPARALPWPQPASAGDTCWFATADAEGRVVSAIQSTYFEFGSGLVLPRTGITWQNRGSSFRLALDGWNALKPGREPFHTLNPALAAFADGRTLAYGTMGGEGQPQTQAALFTRYARYGVNLQEAISRPRWLLGRTWGEQSVTLKLEDRFDPALVAQLRAAGHDVEILAPFTATMGHAGAIVRHPDGSLEGATDPRSDGQVAAW
ncbi:gamma-glutamyltransferase family protein [Sphingomonas sp. M1-B02]|uniref:gamma-glutamyltransferase family protein n=1 Tax=Sphingomonas sp. M1-B02 TaxID=3114300 RepID=UPI00223EA389|nr:gamma-glutamyltransferase family protein [Sphingomonas sp. S6-11]UZK66456.1 gamma-glutamyltransferase family protein [Sphingomonas sp. S6-11]